MTQTRKPDDNDTLRALLRGVGLRVTPARVAVLGLLRRSARPLSHAEVTEALSDGIWDRATLYRNLIDMVDAGLARRSDVDHIWRFEAQSDEDHGHPHFVCTECGTVECIDDVDLNVRRPKEVPRSVRNQQVEIQLRGTCDQCA